MGSDILRTTTGTVNISGQAQAGHDTRRGNVFTQQSKVELAILKPHYWSVGSRNVHKRHGERAEGHQ